MTDQEKRALAFIASEINRTGGVSPTLNEIAGHVGLRSRSGGARIVLSLEFQGYIRRHPFRHRSYEIVANWITGIAGSKRRVSRTNYTSFRFDDHLKTLVEHRKFTAVA